VCAIAGVRLIQAIPLFSGFGYLKKPPPQLLSHLKERAKTLSYLPHWVFNFWTISLNITTRFLDKIFLTHYSQYGWGFIFVRGDWQLEPLTPYFNVCWNCGSGQHPNYLKHLGSIKAMMGIKYYICPCCQARSLFLQPPRKFQDL
jgi:hypothetical protein